uniref:Uncharacterized protein n=1 Tax=Anguilla anguilla TaxID=7936 RepID=A0A0E9UMD8_ANGAN
MFLSEIRMPWNSVKTTVVVKRKRSLKSVCTC